MSPQSPQPVSDRFRYKTADELLAQARALGLDLPFTDTLAPLFAPGEIAGRAVPNRMAAQPMEGCDGEPGGAPGELTTRRYLRFAEGGFGLLWFEATAVLPEARANARQLYITPQTMPAFRDLADPGTGRGGAAIRTRLPALFRHPADALRPLQPHGAAGPAQGRLPQSPARPRANSRSGPTKSSTASVTRWSTARASRATRVSTPSTSRRATATCCTNCSAHGLASTAATAGRSRTASRLLVDSVKAVRAEVPGIDVAVRLNATDGLPQPWGFGVAAGPDAAVDLDEPRRLVRMLAEAGCSLFNITAGIPTYGPHINRPFDRPVAGTSPPPEHPLVGVVRLLELSGAMQDARRSGPGGRDRLVVAAPVLAPRGGGAPRTPPLRGSRVSGAAPSRIPTRRRTWPRTARWRR